MENNHHLSLKSQWNVVTQRYNCNEKEESVTVLYLETEAGIRPHSGSLRVSFKERTLLDTEALSNSENEKLSKPNVLLNICLCLIDLSILN